MKTSSALPSDALTTSEASPPKAPRKQRASAAMRRVVNLARWERKRLAWGTLFLLIGSAMGLIYPQLIREIIDVALSAESNPDRLDQAALIMVAVFGVQGVSVSIRHHLFTVAGERIVTQLRKGLYASILGQEIGFFDQRRTGELTNRLASDTTAIQQAASVNLSMGLRYLASTVGGVGLLAYTSLQLTAVMLLVVPPVIIWAVFMGRRLRKLSRQSQDALARGSEVAEETFSGVRTVRAYSGEPRERARYGVAADEALELVRQRSLLSSAFMGSVTFTGYAAVAVVLWFGGKLVIDGDMSVGALTSFVLYTLIVAFSVGALAGLWTNIMNAIAAAERVFALLEREPEIPLADGQRLEHVRGHVRFEQVDFAYPARDDVTVLRDINLELRPGEVVALVGPSGGGKSTIAALLMRLYDPVSGRITLDTHDLCELSASGLREHMGVVAQDPALFSMSIAENIRYGRPNAPDEAIEEAARRANAHDFIETFPEAYQTQVGERGVQLSGGQRQRVAIARALLRDPAVLILDEATSALDAESEHLVKEALERLMQGRTTLIIAHRLSTVRSADRVVVIEHGRIVEEGSHDALIEKEGLYHRLVERQLA